MTGDRNGDGFRIGSWLIEPSLNTITGPDGTAHQVEPKVMAVLLRLAAVPGAVVSREALFASVWPDTFVTDKVLTRAISELRKIFEDDARSPTHIATIAKNGYRLVAPVGPPIDVDSPLPPPPPTRRTRGRLLAGALAVAGAVVVTGLTYWRTPHHPRPQSIRLTTDPGHELNPALSPDGNLAAYVRNDGKSWDLYVMQPGSAQPLRRSSGAGHEVRPAWSPDGTSLAFYRFTADACSLVVMPALAGPERVIAPCWRFPSPNYAMDAPRISWSPDGRSLATVSRRGAGAPFEIILIDVESGARRVVSHPPPAGRGDGGPTFSPEGSTLAFLRDSGRGIRELYLLRLDSSRESRLPFDYGNILGHDWTADGKHLVVSSNHAGTYALWRVPIAGGAAEWISAPGTNLKAPSIARNGKAMLYEDWSYDTNIWRVALDGSGRREPLIKSTLWDIHPAFSPDGNRIAFVSNRSGGYQLWLREGDAAAPLTTLRGGIVANPQWSPDGTRLLFDLFRDGHSDLYIVPASGGPATRLTIDAADEVMGRWSPDGRSVYFASNRTGGWQIWQMPSAGGEPTQVTRHGGYVSALDADLRVLVFSKKGTPGLWRADANGANESLLTDELAPQDWANWILRADGVYFVRRVAGGKAELRMRPLAADAAITTIATIDQPPLGYEPSIAIAPDGTSMLSAQLDRTEADLILLRGLP